jgi:hypothetical protein
VEDGKLSHNKQRTFKRAMENFNRKETEKQRRSKEKMRHRNNIRKRERKGRE